jgi:hypothetical protein
MEKWMWLIAALGEKISAKSDLGTIFRANERRKINTVCLKEER